MHARPVFYRDPQKFLGIPLPLQNLRTISKNYIHRSFLRFGCLLPHLDLSLPRHNRQPWPLIVNQKRPIGPTHCFDAIPDPLTRLPLVLNSSHLLP